MKEEKAQKLIEINDPTLEKIEKAAKEASGKSAVVLIRGKNDEFAKKLREKGIGVICLDVAINQSESLNDLEEKLGDLWKAVGAGLNIIFPGCSEKEKEVFYSSDEADGKSVALKKAEFQNKNLSERYAHELQVRLPKFIDAENKEAILKDKDLAYEYIAEGLAAGRELVNKNQVDEYFGGGGVKLVEGKPSVHGGSGKKYGSFTKPQMEDFQKVIEKFGYKYSASGSNLITALNKTDKKPVFTIKPNEITAANSSNDEDVYKAMIEAALIKFPGQELVINNASDEEKKKFQKAVEEFKKSNPEKEKEINYTFAEGSSKKSNKDSQETEEEEKNRERYERRVKILEECKKNPTGPEPKKLTEKDEKSGVFQWYADSDIRDIINVTEKKANFVYYPPANPIKAEHGFDKNTDKFYYVFGNDVSGWGFCDERDFQVKIKEALDAFLKLPKNSDKQDRTFVFSINPGGHWITVACNRRGEILVVDSMNYKSTHEAAIKGLTASLRENSIIKEKQNPDVIRITREESEDFSQRGADHCGPVSAAMAVAISPNHSFRDQVNTLKERMRTICTAKNYAEIRQEHQTLIEIGRSKETNKNDQIDAHLKSCQYHKSNLHDESLSHKRTI